jgi:hypothetical protein
MPRVSGLSSGVTFWAGLSRTTLRTDHDGGPLHTRDFRDISRLLLPISLTRLIQGERFAEKMFSEFGEQVLFQTAVGVQPDPLFFPQERSLHSADGCVDENHGLPLGLELNLNLISVLGLGPLPVGQLDALCNLLTWLGARVPEMYSCIRVWILPLDCSFSATGNS